MTQYLTAQVDEMRSKDYTALSLVKAVKGKDPGGRPTGLTYKDKSYKFGPCDPNGAVDVWVEWAVDKLTEIVQSGDDVVLVPVPNKSAVIGSSEEFPTLKLCNRIAKVFGKRATVAAELWWNEDLKPAREGGPRYARDLYPHLILQSSPLLSSRVLIDDVLTSGGHMKACAAKLRECGYDPIGAICCGRTFKHQIDHPFAVPAELLPDFDPKDPRGLKDMFTFDSD